MIKNQKLWDDLVTKNIDPYGKACIDVTREVMRILDEGKEFDCHKIINEADKIVDAGGITGFMAGCVAKMVRDCHSRGNEFNDKWNEGYGVSKKKAKGGTVNPAIFTVGTSPT